MRKKILSMIVGAAILAGLAGCTTPASGNSGQGTVRIGVRVDIRRWAYYDKKKEIYSGAEVDYARALGKEMGYGQVELVPVTPENMKDAIQDGDVDCLVSKCTIMDTKKEAYDFSPSYYQDKGTVMVENSSRITDFKGLAGKRIGYLRDSDVMKRLRQKLIDMGVITEADAMGTEFVPYDSFEEISLALESGEVSGFAADSCILRAWQDGERKLLEDSYQDKKYGVAVIKDTPLSDEVNQAVKDLNEAGVMDKIISRWN